MKDLHKLTQEDYSTKGIRVKPNPLGLPVAEAQRAFDELSLDVIIPKTNEVIDAVNKFSGNIEGLRLVEGNFIEASTDGATYEKISAMGHKILDTNGIEMPARFKMQFNNCEVKDVNDVTVISGIKGDKGDTGDKGQDGYSGVIKDDTTGTLYHLGVQDGLLYIEEAI